MLVMVVSSVQLVAPSTSAARNCNSDFISSNTIAYYNPCAGNACSTVPQTGDKIAASVRGEDNAEKIYNYWIDAGLSPEQAAGITGSMKYEGGFSPFRQEANKTWPDGKYGIAGFGTDGQRAAVVAAIKAVVASETIFNQYYIADYGGGTTVSTDYIPSGVPKTVNDKFLIAELDYLLSYVTALAPSASNPERNTQLTTDYKLAAEPGVKLLDYIKTLKTESDVAKVWTYLYEYPSGNIQNETELRVTAATSILAEYKDNSTDPCSIAAGGLTFDQSKAFMKTYHETKRSYFTSTLKKTYWAAPGHINQCTAFIMYVTNKYMTPLSNTGNGIDTVNRVLASAPSFYKMVSNDQIKPFTVYSLRNSGAGHTGMILGVLADGSIITGEANTYNRNTGGLLEKQVYGSKADTVNGLAVTEHWQNIEALEKSWRTMGYPSVTYAAPQNPNEVIKKLDL